MGTSRVIRGGSWNDEALLVRAAYRFYWRPSDRDDDLGFRLARGQGALEGAEPQGAERPAGLARRGTRPPSRPAVREVPEWASDAGRDESGEWASFAVEGVVQRLRRIAPGRFYMGSPEDEPGRWDDEGPRHLEEVPHEFWLADTPCTQALWEAVTGENPSRFKSPRRPVEQVSWEDCQRFFGTLNSLIAGLDARLPLEAEWEYACRAGTEWATYAGPMEDLEALEKGKAAVLEAIAWYSANSGGRTHNVAGKEPNKWGLHDMLGNVDEWCEDLWRPNYDAPASGSGRVIRGGSWFYEARNVRAAVRYHRRPSYRWINLGFRLARGQAALQGAEPQGAERAAGGARRGTRRRSGRGEGKAR